MESDMRIRLGSYVAGLLFGIGWWFFIGAVAYVQSNDDLKLRIHFVEWLPGIGTTLALFGINAMDWSALTADSSTYHNGSAVACQARSIVLFLIAVAVASLIGSIVLMADKFVDNSYDESAWPGIAIFLQTTLIFFATFIWKLFTAEE